MEGFLEGGRIIKSCRVDWVTLSFCEARHPEMCLLEGRNVPPEIRATTEVRGSPNRKNFTQLDRVVN